MTDKKISALTPATTPLAGTEVLPIVQGGATVSTTVGGLTSGREVSVGAIVSAGGARVQGYIAPGVYGYYLNAGYSGVTIYLQAYNDTALSAMSIDCDNLTVRIASYATGLTLSNTGNLTVTLGNLVQGTAAKGINFTANTPAAGMTSQLLNWYEEGTFTPTVSGSTTAGAGTYAAATGIYTRIGNLVTVQVYMNITAHTGTGNINLTGLPFTSSATAGHYGSVTVGYLENCTVPATSQVLAFINPNTNYVGLYTIPSAGGAMVPVGMDTSFSIMYSATYRVA